MERGRDAIRTAGGDEITAYATQTVRVCGKLRLQADEFEGM